MFALLSHSTLIIQCVFIANAIETKQMNTLCVRQLNASHFTGLCSGIYAWCISTTRWGYTEWSVLARCTAHVMGWLLCTECLPFMLWGVIGEFH